jgi:hypothetical protein
MTDCLKDYYFNSFCKGRKNFVSTPLYTEKRRAMRHSAELRLPAMRHSEQSIFVIEYLHEIEFTCKTVLAHESGDPGVQFNEKTEARKSRETVPLSIILNLFFPCFFSLTVIDLKI